MEVSKGESKQSCAERLPEEGMHTTRKIKRTDMQHSGDDRKVEHF